MNQSFVDSKNKAYEAPALEYFLIKIAEKITAEMSDVEGSLLFN